MNSIEKLAHTSFKSFSKALRQSENCVKRIEQNIFLKWSIPKALAKKFREELDQFAAQWQSKHFREAFHSGLVAKVTLEMISLRMEQSILKGILKQQPSIRALEESVKALKPSFEDCQAQTEEWAAQRAVQQLNLPASQVYENSDGVPWITYTKDGWLKDISPHPLFDASWYRENYDLEDHVDPLSHFMKVGWAQGFKPYEKFDFSDFYNFVQPLLAKRGINPLVLYHQQKGFKELYGDDLITYDDWVQWMDKREETLPSISSNEWVGLVFCGATLSATWVQSLLAQSHSNWELWCSEEIKKESVLDDRVRTFSDWTSLYENLDGKYLIHLDESTLLHPRALGEFLSVFESHPEVQLIYTDEDRYEEGKRRDPYFKPDFSLDLLRSHFYIGKVLAFERQAWLKLEPKKVRITESELWSVALRAALQLTSAQIWHIPQVLWHKVEDPQIEGKVLSSTIVEAHLSEAEVLAKTEPQEGGVLRIRYEISNPQPLVSVIIPTRNGLNFLQRCVESLLEKTEYHPYEVLIVDNQSDDSLCLQWMEQIHRKVPSVKVLHYPHPFNYSAINNFAVKHAAGEVIVLLNNDTEVMEGDWMREMVSLALRPEVGCVGALLLYPNDTVQHAGVVLGVGGVANHAFLHEPAQASGYRYRLRVISEYDAVTAACLAVRKSIFEQVGGLDEAHLAIAFNDVDFCLRVSEAGYKNLVTPFANLYHHESVSRGAEDTPEKYARFKREVEYMLHRWSDRIADRRCYSPHLSLHPLKSFKMAWPPQVMSTKKADRFDQP